MKAMGYKVPGGTIFVTANSVDGGNWVAGMIRKNKDRTGDCVYEYVFTAKVYDEPSECGIFNGRVSKLSISVPVRKGCGILVANYDRGWDVCPDPLTNEYEALGSVLKYFPANAKKEVGVE